MEELEVEEYLGPDLSCVYHSGCVGLASLTLHDGVVKGKFLNDVLSGAGSCSI